MNKDSKRLFENFISLVIVQGGGYIVPLITLPYLVNVLGIESYGKIAYALAFSQYFLIVSSFGFDLSAPKTIAENRDNQGKLNEIFSSVLVIRTLIAVFSIPIVFAVVWAIPSLKEIQLIVWLTYGYVIAQAMAPNWFFQGIERMRLITVTNLGSRVLYAIGLFVFVKNPEDIYLVPIFNSASFLLTGGLAIFLCVRIYKLKFYLPAYQTLITYLTESFSFFLSRVSVSLYTLSNTFVLGTFGSMEMTGIYAVAEKLFQAMQGVYNPLMNSLYPYITRLRNAALFLRIFLVTCIVNVLFVIVAYYLADWIFPLLFKEATQESIQVFRWLLMVTLLIVPSILIGYPFLAAMGHPRYTNMSVIVASGLHLFMLTGLVLVNQVTLFNIVLAVFITEALVLSIRLFGTFKYHLWHYQPNS